jgi:hypothetical protein
MLMLLQQIADKRQFNHQTMRFMIDAAIAGLKI